MSQNQLQTAIEHISKNHSYLSPHCINDLLECTSVFTQKKHTIILIQDQKENYLYFIITGCLGITIETLSRIRNPKHRI